MGHPRIPDAKLAKAARLIDEAGFNVARAAEEIGHSAGGVKQKLDKLTPAQRTALKRSYPAGKNGQPTQRGLQLRDYQVEVNGDGIALALDWPTIVGALSAEECVDLIAAVSARQVELATAQSTP